MPTTTADLRKLVALLKATEDKACALVSADDTDLHRIYLQLGDVVVEAEALLDDRTTGEA